MFNIGLRPVHYPSIICLTAQRCFRIAVAKVLNRFQWPSMSMSTNIDGDTYSAVKEIAHSSNTTPFKNCCNAQTAKQAYRKRHLTLFVLNMGFKGDSSLASPLYVY